MRSLQVRLSTWLSLAVVLVALAAGAFSFFTAYREAMELQDDLLRQTAALVQGQGPDQIIPARPGQDAKDDTEEEAETALVVLTLSPDGWRGLSAAVLSGLPFDLPDGMHTLALEDEGWRVFAGTRPNGGRIAVAQQTDVRNETALDSALRTLLPFLVLPPILMFLVGGLVRGMFRPLKRAAGQVEQRSEKDLGPVPQTGLPEEIQPFVSSINNLMARVAASLALQRRFVADAAHELRTPLTALSLQAESLESSEMSGDARQRLADMRKGIQRAENLVGQLLALARANDAAQEKRAPVSLQTVFRRVLEDFMPLAEAKGIDLGVLDQDDRTVLAEPDDLSILVGNLVGNAIRFTPPGGRIDLSVREDRKFVVMQVDDTGPGIPEAERERVFEPFYRILGSQETGSGLGLSIVRTLCDKMDATVELDWADTRQASGLSVRVTFRKP